MIKTFIKYYKPYRKLFILDLVFAFAAAICDLFYPVVTRNIINDYIPNQQLKLLLIWMAVLLAIYLVKTGFNYFILYWGHLVGVGMQADMRRDVFARVQKLPFSFFDNNKTGTIMSKIINDLFDISELAHHGPEDIFLSFIMLIGSFIILATIHLPLTLMIFACVPFLVWFAMKKRVKMMDAFTATRVEVAEINAGLENSISGVRVAKAYTNYEHENQLFEEKNHAFIKARTKAYKVMADFFSGSSFILDFLNIVVLAAGGVFCYRGDINYGDFVAFLLYVTMFVSPLKRLINFVEQYQNGMSGYKRFHELLSENPEQDTPGARDILTVKGDILFDNVSFAYDDKGDVLKDITIRIDAGQTIALVGPSGGGKTTLCHLLPRFYDIVEGKITIDSIDIRDFTLESLRRHIGIVQQDVFLFTGTIYDNISYGKLDASRDEVIEAARRANIHDFILTLPEGYDTYVGERGIKLSGGQKQRISISRVFLKNPPILILDEATSALDNVTESMIQASLAELSEGRTSIVVAHRLSTVKRADEIIVLTAEGIAERGKHSELLKKENGVYAELYRSQFAEYNN